MYKPKYYILIFYLFGAVLVASSQEEATNFFSPEFTVGKTPINNTGFPDFGLHTALFLNFGSYQNTNPNEWAYWLKQPKTGLSLAYATYGNADVLGYSIHVLPFVEFQMFHPRLSIHAAFGVSYFNKKFDLETNLPNEKISTNINWTYRTMLYYKALETPKVNWRLGLGYFHQSNGHTRFPNQGLNSFSGSVSAELKYTPKRQEGKLVTNSSFEKTSMFYASARRGIGLMAFTEAQGDKKPVHITAISFGKVINKTYRVGIGVFHKFYEHYFDYIQEGEDLIPDYPELTDHPYLNAAAIGVSGIGELQLNHIGLEVELGFNIRKPFYKIDYLINSGYSFTIPDGNGDPVTFRVLGELNDYYQLKRLISSRMGLKYYIIGTEKNPPHNVYVGAHINANLGQADFSELSVGYVFQWE